MGKVLQGLGTTAFVATRVALIVAAGLVIGGTVASIKDRFTGSEADEAYEADMEQTEESAN